MEDSTQSAPRPTGPTRTFHSQNRAPWMLALLGAAIGTVLVLGNYGKPRKTEPPDSNAIPIVGVEATYTLVLNRGDVVAAQPADNAPVLTKIKSIQPVENQRYSYLVSYSGTEKGTFNLTDYLCTPDGERLREPITQIQVESLIPDSADYAILNPPVPEHPAPPHYTALLYSSAGIWLLLGLWLFLPRGMKRRAIAVNPPEQPKEADRTLEDLLRPLVEKAAQKTITGEEKTRMEQILFRYWGALLQLDHLNNVEQLRRILEHKEAGALLRTVEQWLYQPDSKIPAEEIAEILKPYMDLPITEQVASSQEQTATAEFKS